MRREDYERDLKERQDNHLKSVARLNGFDEDNWQPCMHEQCTQCVGTGITKTGGPCVHGLSCPCPRCSPRC